jgi:hypothetical protein
MATYKVRKQIDNAIYDLTATDVVVLDLALAYFQDHVEGSPTSPLASVAQENSLANLRHVVLEIKRGEVVVEED